MSDGAQPAQESLERVLDTLGITTGDTLFLGCDMSRIVLPRYPAALNREAIRERERRWCDFLLSGLLARLGPNGTLLVPTFTYSYGTRGEPYCHEVTKSETGPFTEFVRTRSGAIRSLHPLHSIAGLGKNASAILNDTGRAAYGALSPFARLARFETKFLCLGTTIGDSLTYVHHLEQVYGSNHRYHKAFTTPVYRAGIEVGGPWLCFVRYLGVESRPRIANMEDALRRAGVLRESGNDAGPNQCVSVADVDRIGLGMLAANACAFVDEIIRVAIDESEVAKDPSAGPVATFKLCR